MEWTREKTLSLISEYRKRRGLWDMTSDDYRKKEMKQKLLVEVSASLGGNIPIVEIEKKFHTLRTQYHREINRMKRKEPYNSKWFGFKNLQFLSSPKACRSSKGRIKSEITEEGTVTTKYIIREASSQHDSSGASANSSSNINEEFLTIHRKPTTITYEAVGANAAAVAASTSRSHELEKLIEETTKDVEEVEEAKPKMTLKEITEPIEHHAYNTQLHTSAGAEIANVEHDHLQQQQQQQQQQHHQLQQQQHMETEEEQMETVEMQTTDEEIAYQSSSSVGGNGAQATTAIHHHHPIPTRIIKIQRRDTMQEEDYYDDEHQQTQHHIHTVPASTAKRIYYEANGQQHTATILTTSPSAPSAQSSANATLISPVVKLQHNRNSISQSQAAPPTQTATTQQLRDEFDTYGEYVANEMRTITNREILVALKHKINTALFEAHMTELQK